jgi:hypothetical protein
MGIAWCVGGVISLAMLEGGYWVDPADREPLGWYLLEAAHAIGEVGLLAAVVGVHDRQARRAGRLGGVGFWAAFVGTALVLVGTVGNMVDPEGEVVGLMVLLGLLGWLVGFPLLGVTTLRSKALPGWFGWGLIAFVPIILGLHFVLEFPGVGGLVVGGLWLVFAYGLWTSKGHPETQR